MKKIPTHFGKDLIFKYAEVKALLHFALITSASNLSLPSIKTDIFSYHLDMIKPAREKAADSLPEILLKEGSVFSACLVIPKDTPN